MTATNLAIPPASSAIPTCNPNLMPFHIDYTGPASVSAYMRVEKYQPEITVKETVVEEVSEKETTTITSTEPNGTTVTVEEETTTTTATAVTTATTTLLDVPMTDSTPTTPALSAAPSEDTLVVESQASTSTAASSSTPSPPVLEDADRRFVSTFRGRTIHGLTVDLPEGYAGVVLKTTGKEKVKGQVAVNKTKEAAASKGKGKAPAKGKAKVVEEEEEVPKRGRVTRSAAGGKKSAPIEINEEAEDEEMADAATFADADATTPSGDQPVRELVPEAQFSTFTLWHADRPVDKGRDEYTRTLTEWVSLAHEIHCSDF